MIQLPHVAPSKSSHLGLPFVHSSSLSFVFPKYRTGYHVSQSPSEAQPGNERGYIVVHRRGDVPISLGHSDTPGMIHRTKPSSQSCSLSRNPGSLLTLPSNFFHHSSNAFNGTTSIPPFTFPLKLVKKLNAFLMILCARINVSGFFTTAFRASTNAWALAGSEAVGWREAIWDETDSADSRDMPSVTSGRRVSPALEKARDRGQ